MAIPSALPAVKKALPAKAKPAVTPPATLKAQAATSPMKKVTAKKAMAPKVPTKKAPAQPATVKPTAVAAPAKAKKVKVLRDSFTIPKDEFLKIAELKSKAMGMGVEIKKSELLRAGLMLLASLSEAALKKALANVPTLKTGRPGKP